MSFYCLIMKIVEKKDLVHLGDAQPNLFMIQTCSARRLDSLSLARMDTIRRVEDRSIQVFFQTITGSKKLLKDPFEILLMMVEN